METAYCSALVVGAPSSGSGKTTVVAALARALTQQGKKVRVFKTGPDFIDPQFLSIASGAPVYQLDLWMCGEAECQRLLYKAAQEADVILIEGVMGMFDGKCSSADIATKFQLPMLAVVDASAMTQTFGALVHGLSTYRDDVDVFGVVANRVGSKRHSEMLKESLKPETAFCGWLPKDMDLSLPERHLGLVQAQELDDIEQRLDRAAQLISEFGDIPLPPPQSFHPPTQSKSDVTGTLKDQTIAIANDASFAFLYQANIDLLESLGATLTYFSPLAQDDLPQCDALYLPGGYPELYMEKLARNELLNQQILEHIKQGKPCLAECGGMLYLNKTLTDKNDQTKTLVGALNANAYMQNKLAALGILEASIQGQPLRGHTFHYSKTVSEEKILTEPLSQYGTPTDPVWVKHATVASYAHWYFPYNPDLIVKIFRGTLF
ncbi:putative Cobyrinic acid a,c-diamide synthase CbiA [Vibrio nigripulchritudo SOn1]|uniref:Cobyrinate a,c-diamide synthase n=1 Tax=Vibrio nigripulchritudo SOn1 TaxID=1238450 RepID=A0AAV2VPX8_9VIBR|nr:cobyrinate a,c-diamide synthase [Vibrio nigripulchritudo]CCO46520.1 putative Cobyrinic acid a,c-diamide synthase CbiA [Vibrio nigripulchritudo SOn1]